MPFYSLEHDGNRLRVWAPDLPALKTKVDTMALPAGLHAPCALTCTQIDARDDLRRDWIHVDDLAEANLRELGFVERKTQPDFEPAPVHTAREIADELVYAYTTSSAQQLRDDFKCAHYAINYSAPYASLYDAFKRERSQRCPQLRPSSLDPSNYSVTGSAADFVESFRDDIKRSAGAMRRMGMDVAGIVERGQESAVAEAQGVGISAPKPPPLSYDFSGEDLEMSPEEIRAWKAKNQK